MRGLIIEVSPVSENTSIAHVRNSLYLKKQTGFDICWNDETIIQILKNHYDVLLFSYSSKFCSHELMSQIIKKNPNAKLMWMINEYNGSVPKCLRDAGNVHVIANFDMIQNRDYGYVSEWMNADINSWIIPNETQTKNIKKYDRVYYGTFRPGRSIYLSKYLHGDFYCSSSAKNHKFFRDAGCAPRFIEKLSWRKNKETLSLFDKSLYIEDVFTHSHYNRMSNRFYEALYCDVVPVFDESCQMTIEKSGYKIPEEWIIKTSADIDKIDGNKFEHEKKNLFEQILDVKKTETDAVIKFIYGD